MVRATYSGLRHFAAGFASAPVGDIDQHTLRAPVSFKIHRVITARRRLHGDRLMLAVRFGATHPSRCEPTINCAPSMILGSPPIRPGFPGGNLPAQFHPSLPAALLIPRRRHIYAV